MTHPRCPTCNKSLPTPGSEGAQRALPFCSERCKLIDLNRWFSEDYRVPGADVDAETQPEDLPGPDATPR